MTSGTRPITRRTFLLSGLVLGALILAGVLVAPALASSGPSSAPEAKTTPDYEAVAQDSASIVFPGSTASKEDIEQLLPSTRRATDVACENLKHMARDEVVSYTSVTVGDRTKAGQIVDSMERNVCSRR